jgi:hypothetical protein
VTVETSKLTLLCQHDWGGREERVARQVALLTDIPMLEASLEGIERHAAHLARGACVPVGTVEFVRRAMALAGIAEPGNLSYPQVLRQYLHRQIEQREAGSVLGRWFVKPVTTKALTGFVFDTLDDPAHLSCHHRAQHNAFLAIEPSSRVWVSEPVSWVSEVRYYVLEGEIFGEGRYDDGPDDAPLPDPEVVREMASRFGASPGAPVAFALDVGVLESGLTALVEVNDAWALGFYSGTLEPRQYVQLLMRRWQQLCAHKFLRNRAQSACAEEAS